ncbi:hypothetical protein [Paenibacillus rigui]|uniref:Uncharacterized protein n=1 Tax=Paenibacillus rigui TaxID=554312 RepID=A0A229UT92_9BACL|nr:hypothetical protein [Paenibacillus rigui]OXM86109.1 hypothetical protein CF651_12895 [Paenibacillus rigui]
MKWIQLILNNWFIVVVLFFILSGLFKRRTPSGSQQSRKSTGPSMPPFGGGGTVGPGWGKKSLEMNKGKSAPAAASTGGEAPSSTKKAPESSSTRVGEERKAVLAADNYGQEPQEDFWDTSPLSGKVQASRESSSARHDGSSNSFGADDAISADKLAQGILWAEILGPPRSKKPFRK